MLHEWGLDASMFCTKQSMQPARAPPGRKDAFAVCVPCKTHDGRSKLFCASAVLHISLQWLYTGVVMHVWPDALLKFLLFLLPFAVALADL